MLFLGCRLRSRLDCLKPSVAGAVHSSQEAQQQQRQQHSKDRQFDAGESVLVHDYRREEEKWSQGVVMEKTGQVSYKINVGAQGVWKRHVDQMLARPDPEPQNTALNVPVNPLVLLPPSDRCFQPHTNTTHSEKNDDRGSETTASPKRDQSNELPQMRQAERQTETVTRYPVRIT